MIFVDSSYLVALAINHDQWHEKAKNLRELVETEETILTTINIAETIALIGYKGNVELASYFYEYIKENYKIIDTSFDLCNNSIDKYIMYGGTLSIADVVALEVMEQINISKIVSFDSDFDKVNGISRIH